MMHIIKAIEGTKILRTMGYEKRETTRKPLYYENKLGPQEYNYLKPKRSMYGALGGCSETEMNNLAELSFSHHFQS